MTRKNYKAALETAHGDLVRLLKQQEKINKEIMNRRRLISSLLESLDEEITTNLKTKIAKSFENYQTSQSLTDDIRGIIRDAGEFGIHRSLIRAELSKLGRDIEKHSNPSGTVNAILGRLKENNDVEEVPDGTGVKVLKWKK